MQNTPKIPKGRGRSSLSLKKRLNKRMPSPQNCMQATDNATDLLNAPRMSYTEANEFTPPHKKLNLDDSFDDSPSSFEGHSPTAFLSQTFGSDSPDVGWRWTQDDNELRSTNGKTDSGFSSNTSSSYLDSNLRRARIEDSRRAYLTKRDERRRAREVELRRAEKARVEALLRERLTKLESQFKDAHTAVQKIQEDKVIEIVEKSPIRTENVFDDFSDVFDDCNFDFAIPEPTSNVKNDNHVDNLDDFFNDSDDGLLVAATQQLESDIPELTQPISHIPKTPTPKKVINTTTSTKTNQPSKEKRSSLYMQFLEDDEDDFFVSLDDAWLQKVTQSSKPRSPFQRYKSMPAATTTSETTSESTSSAVATRKTTDNNCDNKTVFPNWNIRNGVASNSSSTSPTIKAIKRHASSHAMTSPSSTKYRGRQLPSRN